jgi:hypothetical protein
MRCRDSVAVEVRHHVVVHCRNPGKSPSHQMNYGFRVGFQRPHEAPNQRMKLSRRGARTGGTSLSLLVAARGHRLRECLKGSLAAIASSFI